MLALMWGEPALGSKSLGVLTRRPAVSFAMLLAIGIVIHESVPYRPIWILIAITCFTCFAALTAHRRFTGTLFLASAMLLIGIALAQREHFGFSQNEIGFFATDEPHLTELEARLEDDPRIIAASPSGQYPVPPKQVVTVDVQQIKTWSGWLPATGRLPIQIDQPVSALQAGQTVQILGMLQRPRTAMNPGEFDWAAYYRQQRILATFTINRAGNVQIIQNASFSALHWMRAKARHLLAAGFTSQHAAEHALLDAMLLGDRDPELRDIEPQFQQTGIGYQLSVSGLHIAFFAWIVFWICRAAHVRPRVTLFVVTGFVVLYTTIASPSHSGVRSAMFSIVFAIAWLSGRSTDRLQMLSLAVIAMLLWHPLDLFSAGFHLSFTVAFALVFLLPALRHLIQSLRNPDDIARPRPIRKSLIAEWVGASLSTAFRCFQFSTIAWLATLPLVVYHFGQASTWSLLGGLLMFPIVMTALIGGAIKIIFTLCWPIAANQWAQAAGWPAHWLLGGVNLLARLPGSSVKLPTPSIGLIVCYYLLLLAPLLPHWSWLEGRRRWFLRAMPLLGVALIFSIRSHPLQLGTDVRVTLLSLGAGQCAVVELPGGHVVLIDAGSTTVPDVAEKIVEPFLHAQGEQDVDEIFLSHGDFDHISAAVEITAQNNVQKVLTSHHFRKNAAGNFADQTLLQEMDQLNRSPVEIALGERFDLGSGVQIEVVWPPQTGDLNSNNAGLVLRLTYAGRSILFPADIQDPAFAGVLKNPSALKSDVLIAPHHGSSEILTSAFLAAVKPQIILSSNFWRLTNKQKHFETMIGNTPLYRTSDCGAITVTLHKDGTFAISTFLKRAKPKK